MTVFFMGATESWAADLLNEELMDTTVLGNAFSKRSSFDCPPTNTTWKEPCPGESLIESLQVSPPSLTDGLCPFSLNCKSPNYNVQWNPKF